MHKKLTPNKKYSSKDSEDKYTEISKSVQDKDSLNQRKSVSDYSEDNYSDDYP